MSETDNDEPVDSEGGGTPTVLVGAVALAIGAIAGILIGFVSGSQMTPEPAPEPEPEDAVAVVEDTGEKEVEDDLSLAQQRVAGLEREVAEKQREVTELQAEMTRRREKGTELVARLKTIKTELANAKSELKKAVREKEGLLKELRLTEDQLQQTRVQRDVAREDALFNRWQDFLKGSQLEICDRGSLKKLGKCRESSLAALSTPVRRDRFAQCVRSGQAAPVVMKLEKGEAMPDFSEMINEEDKVTRGWMIVFCDPTLPEKKMGRLAEGHLPGAAIAKPPVEPGAEPEATAEATPEPTKVP
ncbi:MAG: hypothetical protein AAGA48_11100 [Myxococcota bacterium]